MTAAFLIQLAISAAAVAILVGLAAWLGVPRTRGPMTGEMARRLLKEEFPAAAIGDPWLAPDGMSALARAGDQAMIVYRAGDGHVARAVPWAALSARKRANGGTVIDLGDGAAPRARFAVPDGESWPPEILA